MGYLTKNEYEALGLTDIDDAEFFALEAKASLLLDIETRNFYQFNKLQQDSAFRQRQFKRAIALQVEHMHVLGATTSAEADNVQSWSVDGVSVSSGGRYNATANNESRLLSKEALAMLSGTGLLFRGLSQ